MVWTLIHLCPRLQRTVEDKAAAIRADQRKLQEWRSHQKTTTKGDGEEGSAPSDSNTKFPVTKEELKEAKLTKKSVEVLQEVAQLLQAAAESEDQKRIDAEIEAGLKALADRFKHHPTIPRVPNDVWESAMAMGRSIGADDDVDDVEYWQKKYPHMNAETVQALQDLSANYDLFPSFLMFGFGDYFLSQNWSDEKFKKTVKDMEGIKGAEGGLEHAKWPTKKSDLTTKKRAELLAQVTYDVLNYANATEECVKIQDLKSTAEDIQLLPKKDLDSIVKRASIDVPDSNNKAAIVVALVEKLYDDVIEPASSE